MLQRYLHHIYNQHMLLSKLVSFYFVVISTLEMI
nr:MAG TPA: hypothetical protein [Caudoviricetes sp.]